MKKENRNPKIENYHYEGSGTVALFMSIATLTFILISILLSD